MSRGACWEPLHWGNFFFKHCNIKWFMNGITENIMNTFTTAGRRKLFKIIWWLSYYFSFVTISVKVGSAIYTSTFLDTFIYISRYLLSTVHCMGAGRLGCRANYVSIKRFQIHLKWLHHPSSLAIMSFYLHIWYASFDNCSNTDLFCAKSTST